MLKIARKNILGVASLVKGKGEVKPVRGVSLDQPISPEGEQTPSDIIPDPTSLKAVEEFERRNIYEELCRRMPDQVALLAKVRDGLDLEDEEVATLSELIKQNPELLEIAKDLYE